MRKAQSRLPQRPSSSISGLLMPALEAHTGESHATARISTSTAGTQSGLLKTVSGPAGTLAVNSHRQHRAAQNTEYRRGYTVQQRHSVRIAAAAEAFALLDEIVEVVGLLAVLVGIIHGHLLFHKAVMAQLPVQLFRLSQQLRRLTPKLLKFLFLLLSRSRFQSYTIPIFLKIRCQRFLQLIIPFTQLLKFSPKSEYHILTASLILALFHEFMDILNLIFIQNCLLLILQTIHIGFQLLHSAFSAAG